MPIPQTIIRFPEIKLQARDAHQLRGYFGNLFKEKSELLHNHMGNGELRYNYPLVQYKVIDQVPMLVALADGAQLLPQLFLQIRELNIKGTVYPVHQKQIEATTWEPVFKNELLRYQFKTNWMALNQANHKRYQNSSRRERQELLNRTLVGNMLSMLKGIGVFADEKIEAQVSITNEREAKFKNNRMLSFTGSFRTNLQLPNFIGLGKQVARGFGSIHHLE
jgi:hypothetical protein